MNHPERHPLLEPDWTQLDKKSALELSSKIEARTINLELIAKGTYFTAFGCTDTITGTQLPTVLKVFAPEPNGKSYLRKSAERIGLNHVQDLRNQDWLLPSFLDAVDNKEGENDSVLVAELVEEYLTHRRFLTEFTLPTFFGQISIPENQFGLSGKLFVCFQPLLPIHSHPHFQEGKNQVLSAKIFDDKISRKSGIQDKPRVGINPLLHPELWDKALVTELTLFCQKLSTMLEQGISIETGTLTGSDSIQLTLLNGIKKIIVVDTNTLELDKEAAELHSTTYPGGVSIGAMERLSEIIETLRSYIELAEKKGLTS